MVPSSEVAVPVPRLALVGTAPLAAVLVTVGVGGPLLRASTDLKELGVG